MSLKNEESFNLTWRVKNFSMCNEELGVAIESPIVRIKQFGNSEWCLKLYPRGYESESVVSCFLVCKGFGIFRKIIKMEFNLYASRLTSNVTPIPSESDFTPVRPSWGYDKWIPMGEISNEKDEYLPTDTLTIKCSMKFKSGDCLSNEKKEVSEENSLSITKCCCETIIPVQTRRFLWSIRRFQSLPENKRITMPMHSAMATIPSYWVNAMKRPGSRLRIEITQKEEKHKITVLSRCTVRAVSVSKGADDDHRSEDKFLFICKGMPWILIPFLNLGKLEEDGYFERNDGVLHLRFDFAFSTEGKRYHVERQYWDPFVPPPKTPIPTSSPPDDDDDDDDVKATLRVLGKTFRVSWALLKAESKVFHDMAESSEVVEIPNVHPLILEKMIDFLSSRTVEGLSTVEMCDLYAAADRYQVLSLTEYCTRVLMSSLTESNVCWILALADALKNDRLLKLAQSFVVACTEPERLLMSEDWKNLMLSCPTVASNVMYEMLLTRF